MRPATLTLSLAASCWLLHCSTPPGSSNTVGPIVAADGGAEAMATATPAPCSTGTPYDPTFGSKTFSPTDPGRPLPDLQCTPRCGDTSRAYWGAEGGPSPTLSALPTGPCENAAPCSMQAVAVWCAQPTASLPTLGPLGTLDQFVCECTSGTWTCSGAGYVAGGPGLLCNVDAGSDAGDGG